MNSNLKGSKRNAYSTFYRAKQYVCDFETTVYDGQTETEVWASAVVELGSEDVKIFHSIGETLEFFSGVSHNSVGYYHNLRFDGMFWIDFLLRNDYTQAYNGELDFSNIFLPQTIEWMKEDEMPERSFKYLIDKMGAFYQLIIRLPDRRDSTRHKHKHFLKLVDSLKLLPMSVKAIGKGFDTKHQKLEMEYKGKRFAGCEITDEEKEYIANDVLVVSEALQAMQAQGYNKLTIGSCCLNKFIKDFGIEYGKNKFNELFPNLYIEPCPIEGFSSAGDYVRKAYRGGWCYAKWNKTNKLQGNGITLDVNSLYPSMMHSCSGNHYPFGLPAWFIGEIPEEAKAHNRYYFVRFRTRFNVKCGCLPWVQLKSSRWYGANDMLETSDIFFNGEWHMTMMNDGVEELIRPTITMTCTDFELLKETYNLEGLEILDGCYFELSSIPLFDSYIDEFMKIKKESTGAKRQIAKLSLNNLYGKFAASPEGLNKIYFLGEDELLHSCFMKAGDRTAGYIPVGAAITSFARNFTIRAALANYSRFCYADTDSLHMTGTIDDVVGCTIDSKELCCWKHESTWQCGLFVRAKTYIEDIDGELDIKCAGMPQASKDLFVKGVEEGRYKLTDFKQGLTLSGKLLPRIYKGGIVLVDTEFTMRG